MAGAVPIGKPPTGKALQAAGPDLGIASPQMRPETLAAITTGLATHSSTPAPAPHTPS